MSDDNEIRHGRHCVFKMHVHLVFVSKYRRKVFDGDAIDRLRRMFAKVCTDFEASLVEMDGGSDHVHLLVEYPPKISVSALVNSLKGASSRHRSSVHRTTANTPLANKGRRGRPRYPSPTKFGGFA